MFHILYQVKFHLQWPRNEMRQICKSPSHDQKSKVSESIGLIRTKISQDIKHCRESRNINLFSLWLIWNVPIDDVFLNLPP